MEKATQKISMQNKQSNLVNQAVPKILLGIAMISILTSIGIVITLVVDASHFFSEVGFKAIFSTELMPLRAQDPKFGFLPLIVGTISTSLIAIMVAIPIGLSAAVFLSEYTNAKTRKILKPMIEVLAGIPTIVYGFFAYSVVTPLLMRMIPTLESKNALSPGIVMGIMIIPIITSLSEDAMSAVPNAIREGAISLGATKLEMTFKVVIPSALSGIIAAFILGLSRAIGETMIVTIASGSSKAFTLDITKPMQTMTGYIVEFTSGDAGAGTLGYYSLYAVGLMLFLFTFLMNMIARYVTKKYRRVY